LGKIILTIDDGVSTQLSIAAPLLARFGLRATFFVVPKLTRRITRRDSSRLGWGEIGWIDLRSLAREGHEIGNHTLSHLDLVPMEVQQARREIEHGQELIEDELRRKVTSFAYPFGRCHPWLYPLVSRGHQLARTAQNSLDQLQKAFERMAIPAWEVFPDTTLYDLIGAATQAAERKKPLGICLSRLR